MPLLVERTGPGRIPTILFIDDDPFQALAYTAALESRFHHVRRVANAVEALCLVEDSKIASQVDLVIFAHHWAGMSGPDFEAELHRRLPAVPVLVLGTDEELAEDYLGLGRQVVFLQRPVTAKELIETAGAIMVRHFRNVA